MIEMIHYTKQSGSSSSEHIYKMAGLVLMCALTFYYFHGSSPAQQGPLILLSNVTGAPGNPKVFFDVSIGGGVSRRVEFELFTGEKGVGKSGAWSVHRNPPTLDQQARSYTMRDPHSIALSQSS